MGDALLRPQGDINPAELRAMIAAQVGPLRVVFGSSRPFSLAAAQGGPVEVARNTTNDRIMYLELRMTAGAGTIVVDTNSGLALGSSPSFVLVLNVPIPFLVYPGEELFVRDPAGGGPTLLISRVFV